MTQILRATFTLRADETVDVPIPPADIRGHAVRCIVRVVDEDWDVVRVVHLECGSRMVLLPDDGLLAADLRDVPLRMPVGPALRMHMRLRSAADVTGYVLVVVEAAGEPVAPSEFKAQSTAPSRCPQCGTFLRPDGTTAVLGCPHHCGGRFAR